MRSPVCSAPAWGGGGVTTTRAFRVGTPEVIATLPDPTPGTMSYAVGPDGTRLIALTSDERAAPREYRVILNGFDELRAKVRSR